MHVWYESVDGQRHGSPENIKGRKDCGQGIKHISNVPPSCIADGRFDFLRCRVPAGKQPKHVAVQEGQLTKEKRADNNMAEAGPGNN